MRSICKKNHQRAHRWHVSFLVETRRAIRIHESLLRGSQRRLYVFEAIS